MKMKRVLILGGGFGGIYAALEFEKRQDPDFEVTPISQDNFFLFTPMLHEVAASDLDLTHIVNPIRKMLRYVHFFEGEVRSVDVVKHEVVVSHSAGDQHDPGSCKRGLYPSLHACVFPLGDRCPRSGAAVLRRGPH